MLGKRLIKSNDAGGGGCTNTVDLYNPFPDGGGVALYQLNGNADDVSGNYDGTATNVTYGSGQFGQAGVFNGSNTSWISIDSLVGSISDNQPLTVSLWFNPNGSQLSCLFEFGNFVDGCFRAFTLADNTVSFQTGTNDSTDLNLVSTENYTPNSWNHISCVFNGTTMFLYLNNVFQGQLNNSYDIDTVRGFIGSSKYANQANFYNFNGSIDQVRIFNRALRPYEVEALYTEEYCTPTIVPSEHFNTVTYTGNGSTQSITGVGFETDLLWIKNRSNAADHALQDTVRGINLTLRSSSTVAEFNGGYVSSVDLDGFTLGSSQSVNASSQTYVAWNFKAGGAAVTNTDGTITSQVSANTEAGFSIVNLTIPNANTQSVGHGLDTAPSVIIMKARDAAESWLTYHSSVGLNKYLLLNSTSGEASYTGIWSDVNSSTFTTVYHDAIGSPTRDVIAYCFAEVEGFSSFGSYVGNDVSTTVVTGFEPAFVIVKNTQSGFLNSWVMLDNKRQPTNPKDDTLYANLSNAESTQSFKVNFLENGFEVTTGNSDVNANGAKYIYMAFAADPTAVEPTLEDSFNTVLYTGNGGSQSITGVGFQPDLVWQKYRSLNYPHYLVDSVRGGNKSLSANLTNAEETLAAGITFENDGFNILGSPFDATFTQVAWCWKGAEIPAINSNGSIPSVVSANPAAGFSIVSWNGIGAAQSIGHGLDAVPSIIIQKRRTVGDWEVYTSTTGANQKLLLNSTAAAASSTAFGNTTPTSSVYYAGAYADPMIAYCFAEVAGFSKFGSYNGGSTNTIVTGFEPAFLMVKRTNGDGNWYMYDNKRDTTNPIDKALYANLSNAESTLLAKFQVNFETNGFSYEDTTGGSVNAVGGEYIYMAFANQF